MYLLEQNGEYYVFDIISDITSCKRIISTDIMSKLFCDTSNPVIINLYYVKANYGVCY